MSQRFEMKSGRDGTSPQACPPGKMPCRVIISLDLDCFYAQCETLRRPELAGKPVGVQQKMIIVTSNYEARAYGLKKCDSVSTVRSKCPSIVICNGEDLTFYRIMSHRVFQLAMEWSPRVERLGMDEVFLDVTEEVDRRASKLARAQVPSPREGCDAGGSQSAVPDLPSGRKRSDGHGDGRASKRARKTTGGPAGQASACLPNLPFEGFVYPSGTAVSERAQSGVCANAPSGHVHGGGSEADQTRARLAIGSLVAAELRADVLSRLKLTASAGVSVSKLLSKMVASANKPNKQTVLVPEAAPLLALLPPHLPLARIPGIGRATAARMKSSAGLETVHDFLSSTANFSASSGSTHSVAAAQSALQLDAKTIMRYRNLCMGQDESPVVQSKPPQTVSVEDSFWPHHQLITTMPRIEAALDRLARTLMVKIRQDHVWYGPRRPSTIALTVRMHSASNSAAERVGRESRQEKLDLHTFPAHLPNPALGGTVCTSAKDLSAGDLDISRKLAARGLQLFEKMYPRGSEFACHIVNISIKYNAGASSQDGTVPITRFMVSPTQAAKMPTTASSKSSERSPSCGTASSTTTSGTAQRAGGGGGGGGGGGISPKRAPGITTRGVRNYFGTSRLSFIGTWKTRFKQFMKDLRGPLKERERSKSPLAQQLAAMRNPAWDAACHAQPEQQGWAYMHIDVDCFFVSVAVQSRSDITPDTPVAVVSGLDSTSEVCSANYPARGKGLYADMFVKEAKKKCPGLVLIPTSAALFEQLTAASRSMYHILLHVTDKIKPVSCDEMYIQVRRSAWSSGVVALAQVLRTAIKDTAGVPVSIGLGHSTIAARFGTTLAKPPAGTGVHSTGAPGEARALLADTHVRKISGIGRSTADRLEMLGVRTCREVLAVATARLGKEFGDETSRQIVCMAQGNDHVHKDFDVWHVVNEIPKTIQNDVNWGVRLATLEEAKELIADIAGYVTSRLVAEGLAAGSVTLKIRNRRPGASEPAKAGGHGLCDQWSRSARLPLATDKAATVAAACHRLVAQNNRHVSQIRGMGISLSKLTRQHQAAGGAAGQKTLAEVTRGLQRRPGIPEGSGATGPTCVDPLGGQKHHCRNLLAQPEDGDPDAFTDDLFEWDP